MRTTRHSPLSALAQLAAYSAAAVLLAATVAPAAAAPARQARTRTPAAGRVSAGSPGCRAQKAHDATAAKIVSSVEAVLRSRFTAADPAYNPFDDVSLAVSEPAFGLRCWYHSNQRNFSASAVKATILAALLLKAQDEHRVLTAREKSLAQLMITQSDNDAATALWDDVGHAGLQHFLSAARMTQTKLDTGELWGLSEITAHDETLLLRLLMSPGTVLSTSSRDYELTLMNHVIPSERWGVRAGSPKYYSWHIKNGWAPLPDLNSSPWVVNSIGCFLHNSHRYTIVVLTHDNPGPGDAYGIATIGDIAWAINRALVPGAKAVWPR